MNESNKSLFPLEDNYIYISHLGEDFKFWKLPHWPDEISDHMGSTFTPTTALGRTAPIYTYSSSGPRSVQISIPLHRDIMDDVNYGVSNVILDTRSGEDYVENLVNALRAISLPKYNVLNKSVEPPMVALRISNEIFIKGVVNGDIGLSFSKPILSNGKYARIDLSLTITETDPYDAQQVFEQGGFRGVVRTLKGGMNLGDYTGPESLRRH